MDALTKLLFNVQKRNTFMDSTIQNLERRVKILEEENNPIAIVEPEEFDFISGGRVINTCEITSVGAAGLGVGSGKVIKDLGAGGGDAVAILKFAAQVAAIDGVHIAFKLAADIPKFLADLEDTDSYAGSQMIFKVAFITVDFDISTVTEAVATFGEQSFQWTASVGGGVLKLETAFSGDLEMTMTLPSIGMRFKTIGKENGPYFGLKVSLDGSAGVLSNGKIECDVDIDTNEPTGVGGTPLGLTANSSYVATTEWEIMNGSNGFTNFA